MVRKKIPFNLTGLVKKLGKGSAKFKVKDLQTQNDGGASHFSLPPKPESEEETNFGVQEAPRFPYKRPPLDLLESDTGKPSSGDIKANSNIIKRTLQNFGIEVEMGEVNIGPTVTQYTLKPAEGVKLSRIIALSNDLSLALAAHPLRLEAPLDIHA